MTKMEKLMKSVNVMAESPDRGDSKRLVRELVEAVRRRNVWVMFLKEAQQKR
jgi:hypothetical protein